MRRHSLICTIYIYLKDYRLSLAELNKKKKKDGGYVALRSQRFIGSMC
jgi:hypothetical protein